jgi:riboflavin synthase alpha subunit
MKVSRKFGKTNNRMGGHHLEGHITDLRNTMTEDKEE